MDYEKAYNKALERAKKWYNAPNADKIPTYANRIIVEIFPELKESEDERIRGAIIDHLKDYNLTEFAAWLEKQKSVGEIVERCKNSWYNEGKIAGQFEGITDDEKYQQGWHDALEKQGKKKPIFNADDWYVSKVDGNIHDMIEDKDAFTNPGAFENSLGRLLKLFEKLPKQDLLDGLKFYTNVVEHDGEYVKPTEWNDEDERMCQETIDWFKKKCFPYALEHENPARESIRWLKSLKERLS